MNRKLIVSGLVGAIAVLGAGSVASAQVVEDIISLPVDSVLRAPEGSVTLVASAPVPGEFVGASCIAGVEVDNQESVHDGNDLIVSSGGTSGVVENFESEAFGVRTIGIPLTLGATVDVSLRMGEDEISSGGVFITIDCTQTAPPTTAPEPTTPTTTIVSALPPGGGATSPPAQPSAPSSGSLPATGPSGTTWAAVAATLLLGAGFGLTRLARPSR
jgi:LPXTG-motif cell wall-anchored protein